MLMRMVGEHHHDDVSRFWSPVLTWEVTQEVRFTNELRPEITVIYFTQLQRDIAGFEELSQIPWLEASMIYYIVLSY